jgi:hypothetical protein
LHQRSFGILAIKAERQVVVLQFELYAATAFSFLSNKLTNSSSVQM